MAKRKRLKKTANDIVAHFQRRCIERIGIILNQRVLKTLLANGKLLILNKQSNAKTVFKLLKERYNGKTMLHTDVVLIYDKRRHSFVTVMPFDSWRANHDYEGRNLNYNYMLDA